MKMYQLPVLIAFFLFFTIGLFAQNTSVLPSIKDNTMFSESGTKSLGAGKVFTGQNCQGNIRRGLMQFDLSTIPNGAVITEVTLRVSAEKSGGNGDGVIDILGMTKAWGEGFSSGSGNGGPAVAPDATWTDAMLGTSFWDSPGGDFDPAILSSRFTNEVLQVITFPSSANFVAQAQAWLNDPTTNHGILIRGVEGQNCTAYRFGARDVGTAPELIVTWNNGCEPPITNLSIQACDTYTSPGGFTYTMSGTYNEVIPGPNDCDSIFNIDLLVFETSELFVNGTLCDGQSYTLEGIVFDQNNPSGVVTYQSVNGCDSLVIVDLAFEPNSTSFINETLCDGEFFSVTVNGTVYNENNPQGCEMLVSENGCDSIICVDLIFLPPSMGTETYMGCEGDGYSVVVEGTIYDESNPSGIEVLEAIDMNGCDSTVVIDLEFGLTSQVEETYSGCIGDGYSIEVEGNIYDESNPNGTEFLVGSNGCDSIVTIDLDFALEANAGTPTGPLDICNDNQGIVDLNTLLTGADAGGVWTETSPTPSTGLSGNQFDGNGQITGTYIFRYTVNLSTCPEDFTEVTINVGAPITATVAASDIVCNNTNNGNSSIVNFNDLITAGATNGIWTDENGVGVDLSDLTSVDFVGIPLGTYTFPYTTPANGNCPGQVYSTTIMVEDCICPSITTNENYTGCQGDDYEVIVNSVAYNETNPSGVETMTSVSTGCDSIVNINLIFNSPGIAFLTVESCDTSGPATDTQTIPGGAFNGCDSIINIAFVYLGIDEIDIFASSCNPIDVGVETISLTNINGCDSIITTTTSLLPSDSTELFSTSCNPLDTGVFVTTLVNINGCDSVVTTTTALQPLDNSVVVSNITIIASTFGGNYQWVDCGNNNAPIAGATDQSFTPETSGNYAVMITQSGCTVMSECNLIVIVGTEEVWFQNQLSVMPNPTSGDIRLTFGDLENVNIRILDLTGRTLLEKKNLNGGLEDLRIEGPAGVYFVEVEVDGVSGWMKVVKGN